MKAIGRIIGVLTTGICLMVTGCELESPDNGNLDGMWQLRDVDTLAINHSGDVREKGIFWMVQANLLEVKRSDNYNQRYLFRFKKTADELILSDPYLDDRTIGDSMITSPECLKYFGINRLEEHYVIEKMDGSKMVLKSDSLRLSFRKY